MDSNIKYIEETEQFIKDTCLGKFSDNSCEIQQWQDLRYDFNIVENVNDVENNVILYGLSR